MSIIILFMFVFLRSSVPCGMMAAAWTLDEALADEVNLDRKVCNDLVNMIDKEQCTLPFIAR